jgi:hypothetical protein
MALPKPKTRLQLADPMITDTHTYLNATNSCYTTSSHPPSALAPSTPKNQTLFTRNPTISLCMLLFFLPTSLPSTYI